MAETLDLSIYVKRQDDGTAHLDLAVEGIDCAACIDEIEGGLCQLPGIVDARLNYTNHRLAVEWRDGAVSPARRGGGTAAARLPRSPVPVAAGGGRGGPPRQMASEMPRGGGLCLHEHHAAGSLRLVRQRDRHHARDPRLLPLARRPHRPAGRGLCRPAVLSERHERAAQPAHQHGRADRHRHPAGARPCRWSRPSTPPSTPISTRWSCCSSSCSAAAISIRPCGGRPARSRAISPRSGPKSRTGSRRTARSSLSPPLP